jgi:hypothetical protein
MAIPWLTVVDAVLDAASFALSRKPRRALRESDLPARAGTTLSHIEARLAGVAITALKEVFERDERRLELEREQIERERRRAERLLALDLWRQAGDREIGRLRLLAGVAAGSWIGTLLFSARLSDGPTSARVMLGFGWLFLLAALLLSFAAQSRVSRALARIDEPTAMTTLYDDLSAGLPGAAAAWLIALGLGVIGVAVLIG